ncbi:clathrin interactor 1-like isoform X3 [Pomacea canaliculata]|uniref:clathrin interactor 1-like isoform X3 n=1 Tax=Pomacea canaliculata TaxID=400727 RepID=UPI000D736C87|nr:clathrin interactor 1-like isoform X3 [Pomacea canaliculata]
MISMWKIRELTDKVTNVVMNYSEVETKVREATNDDAWGPHGQLMKEIAQYTFTYEHFPEVMGMLWKRMLLENKKNWRRVYKSLILLSYLVKNGSERVVTSAREHIYDLRRLESYTFTDENGKDQGLNVRHKVKELLEFIQDDDRLREERKKAKKTKDKYVGVSGEIQGGVSKYSDRYDEEPRRGRRMEEIEEWDHGKKSVVGEAIDKAKDLWQRASGRRGPDKYDYEEERNDDDRDKGRESDFHDHDWDRDSDRSRDRHRSRDDWNDRDRDRDRQFKDEFRDDDEYTSVERTQTTHTEKITTNRRTRSIGKKLDLGAASVLGKDADTKSQTSDIAPTTPAGPNLIDVGLASGNNGVESFADFNTFQSNRSASTDDFDPRAAGQTVATSGEFGDFAHFQTANAGSPTGQGFADFSQFKAASNGSTLAPMTDKSASSAGSAGDLLDVFSPATANTSLSLNLNANTQVSMSAAMNMPIMGGQMAGIGMGMPMTMQPVMSTNLMPQTGGMGTQGGMFPLAPLTPASAGWASSQEIATTVSTTETVVTSSKKTMPSTWSDSKVDISLDALNPAARQNKMVTPSLNQMQQQMTSPGFVRWYDVANTGLASPTGMMRTNMGQGMVANTMMAPGMMGGQGMAPGMIGGQGMAGLAPGFAAMSLQSPTGMPMMAPHPMMGQPMGYGIPPGMTMTAGMMGGLNTSPMGMTAPSAMQSSFQQRTDQAFASFGNIKK